MDDVRCLLVQLVCASLMAPLTGAAQGQTPPSAQSPIRFDLIHLSFRLYSDESPARNAPESMAGGIAVFDYNGDGRPDIFFANGCDLSAIGKSDARYSDHLFRNNGDGTFTDVTEQAAWPAEVSISELQSRTTTTMVIPICSSPVFTAMRSITTTVMGPLPM